MLLVVGRIGRPHGVGGDVTVEVRTDDPETRFAPGSLLATDPAERGPLTVRSVRRSGRFVMVRFVGVDDREAAEALRGTVLQVDADDLPELGADEYYDHQLIGLRIVDMAGGELGTVSEVLHPPASPVLVVARPDRPDELVPFVAAIVPEVHLGRGLLVVDPPDGLFT